MMSAGAININAQFGQAPGTLTSSGPYDNTNATTGPKTQQPVLHVL